MRSGTVSIHAPWEGCDRLSFCTWCRMSRFQFTHPGKGATTLLYTKLPITFRFQFTHPGKGATGVKVIADSAEPRFNSRTLGRVRLCQRACVSPFHRFQFTHPGKGATTLNSHNSNSNDVSIHAPWEGCDLADDTTRARHQVSIHAPWEGCDSVVQSCVL